MKKILPVIMMWISWQLVAQQVPHVYNQYFMNTYVYNPAYVGVEGHAVLFLMYKNQWAQVDGAPVEMHANFHVPLKGGLAFGAFAFNETTGPFTTSGGKITGGYLVNIDRTHFLRFGLSLGAGNTMLDQNELDSPTDPAFGGLTKSSSFLLGDVGATYHFGHFNIGVALPTLFNSNISITQTEGLAPVRFKPTDNVMFKMNYRGHINDDIAIEPHVIYRYNKYFPDQYEGTVILHIYHLVWAGATYRQDAGFAGLLGFKIKEMIGIGYSYGAGNPSYSNQLGGTHEIHIGYHIGTKKAHAEHVSSFIKSHRLNAEQRAKQAELERQRKLQELRESREAAQTQQDQGDELGILGAPPVVSEVEQKPKNTWNYEREENLVERVNEFGETERGIKFDRINAQGEKEVVFSWLPPPPPGSTSETYEIANPEEPPAERKRPDGTTEVGVKWIRTLDNGSKEMLIIWDPILSETEAAEIDHEPSEAMGLGDAKIVIKAKPPTPTPPITTPTPSVEVETTKEPEITPEPEEIAEEPETVVEEPVVTVPELSEDTRTHEQLAQSDEHLEVKRGNHLLELRPGNYVVAGAFKSFQHAEDFSDTMFNRGFHDTIVGYVSARGFYYVVIFQSSDLASANNMKNRVKSRAGLSEVWVLKVNE